jgi:uncharacterized membrane protein
LLVRIPRWVLGIYVAAIVMPSTLILLMVANGKVAKSYAPTFITVLVVGFVLAMIFGFFYGRAQDRMRGAQRAGPAPPRV